MKYQLMYTVRANHQTDTPVVKDIVLIGGGHSHVAVLRMFGMKPMPGVRLTLITRDIHTPYSGMLPGYVAGHYHYDQVHIDLGPLARFANARLYHGEVDGVDLNKRLVHVPGRPPIQYDLLSINIGSRPRTIDVPGALEHALPVKPIDKWLTDWEALQQRVLNSQGNFKVIVVGGGAGGVELALSTQHRLRSLLQKQDDDVSRLYYELLTDNAELFPTHNAGVRCRFTRVLAERKIDVQLNSKVVMVEANSVQLENGDLHHADAVLWVTSAGAPEWPKASGLAVDTEGFIQVDHTLRSTSHPEVFAAGDIASMPNPRPKSGVFAVRQGPVLTENLRRAAAGRSLKIYRAQKNFLGLISTGDQYAIASRGNWSWEGKLLWTWKDWIDQRFMQRFNKLPEMAIESAPKLGGIADAEAIKELSTLAMRCGGCGAKVGSTVLRRVINQLPPQHRDDVLLGLDAPDDAAAFAIPPGKVMVQSVDYFRAFIDDPYTFGRIAANHALGDIFAMGAEAQSALAIATVPYGREKIVEQTLADVMTGALDTLAPTGAVLAGGHSSEGAELAFGLTVNGIIERQALLRKGGMQVGDVLILTKPIGTGTLFAADMRGKAKGRWIDGAIQSMLVSNQDAANCLYQHGATACTDVTGFGLLGHLVEMTRASNCDVQLELNAVPLLDGAEQTVAAGILSSLQPQNVRLRRAVRNSDKLNQHTHYPLLFDPQTAGGLLASVPVDKATACITKLHELGYAHAVVIGKVQPRSEEEAPIGVLI
jgi:selenide,water dikinase